MANLPINGHSGGKFRHKRAFANDMKREMDDAVAVLKTRLDLFAGGKEQTILLLELGVPDLLHLLAFFKKEADFESSDTVLWLETHNQCGHVNHITFAPSISYNIIETIDKVYIVVDIRITMKVAAVFTLARARPCKANSPSENALSITSKSALKKILLNSPALHNPCMIY